MYIKKILILMQQIIIFEVQNFDKIFLLLS